MKQKIINILKEIRPEFEFSSGIDFISSGMLDSFDVLTLVNELEEKFGISIDGLDIVPENFCTIESIVGIINKNE
mgnify:FL=1|tara:strand:+ start:693 stop:917 length:225 start_codon:yes stop_codon:yes gene_type:complete